MNTMTTYELFNLFSLLLYFPLMILSMISEYLMSYNLSKIYSLGYAAFSIFVIYDILCCTKTTVYNAYEVLMVTKFYYITLQHYLLGSINLIYSSGFEAKIIRYELRRLQNFFQGGWGASDVGLSIIF